VKLVRKKKMKIEQWRSKEMPIPMITLINWRKRVLFLLDYKSQFNASVSTETVNHIATLNQLLIATQELIDIQLLKEEKAK
jgi:hypothetical protein